LSWNLVDHVNGSKLSFRELEETIGWRKPTSPHVHPPSMADPLREIKNQFLGK